MTMLLSPYRFATAGGGGSPQPAFSDVVFLLDMNDTDALQGAAAGWDDASTPNHTIVFTPSGSSIGPETDTAIVKWGPTAALYKQSIDRLWLNSASDLNFGSGAFTAEGWFYWSNIPAGFAGLVGKWNRNSQRAWGLQYNQSAGVLEFNISANGTTATPSVTYSWTPTLSTWYHIAGDFDGTTYRLYIDGVMVASSTSAVTMFASSGSLQFQIGCGASGGSTDRYFDGSIEDVRVSKVAVYASDSGFTVPSAAFPRS
jgi:hypothetical protein